MLKLPSKSVQLSENKCFIEGVHDTLYTFFIRILSSIECALDLVIYNVNASKISPFQRLLHWNQEFNGIFY